MSADDAVAFLRSPVFAGRQSLTAIDPQSGRIETRLFESADDPMLHAWIAARDGRWNLYFSVNEPGPNAPTNSKLKESHVGRIRAFHVDLDPRKGVPLGEARQEIVDRIRTAQSVHDVGDRGRSRDAGRADGPQDTGDDRRAGAGEAAPAGREPDADARAAQREVPGADGGSTDAGAAGDPGRAGRAIRAGAVVDTGNGFALYVPAQPGTSAAAARRTNRALGILLGGDATHNVDRIMRLPGTHNIPDERKRAAGRVVVRSGLAQGFPEQPTFFAASDLLAVLPNPDTIDPGTGDTSAERVEIEAARAEIQRTPYELVAGEARGFTPLPADQAERIRAALHASPALHGTWTGTRAPQDTSASGYRMALAAHAKAAGLGAGDYACLAASGEHTAQRDHEIDAAYVRQLARAYARAEGFAPTTDPAAFFAPIPPEPEEPPSIWDLAPADSGQQLEPLAWIDASAIPITDEIPEQGWLVENLIPRGEVTSLYGSGGEGKSLIALQLCVCLAAGIDWLGMPTARRQRAFAIFCEDKPDEIRRRLKSVMTMYGLEPADLGGRFQYLARRGGDNLLCTFDRDNTLRFTPFWGQLDEAFEAHRPDLRVIDTLTDTFGGQEIDRYHVNAFVKRVLGPWTEPDASVLLLAHPSRAGVLSGDGLSGSTHWENAVRSRLYLHGLPKAPPEDPTRLLEAKKLNVGPRGSKVMIRWSAGAFIPVASSVPAEPAAAAAPTPSIEDVRRERVLAAIEKGMAGQPVSWNAGARLYAPRLVRLADPQLESHDIPTLLADIKHLLATGRIVETRAKDESRHERSFLARGVF